MSADGARPAAEVPSREEPWRAQSLPVPLARLVGRGTELAQIEELVQAGVRLLTLTGPGGTGKTRLALAAARAVGAVFSDGVFFVSLAGTSSPEQMWSAIADAVGVQPELEVPNTVLRQLADRRAMLVLDNLEHLPHAGDTVRALLDGADSLVVLATSRRRLRLMAERELAVPPLPPESARELFVSRAQAVRPGFDPPADDADLALVCERLDGLPLALELAASRIRLLSLPALRSRLESSLELSGNDIDRPARQHTLRATMSWSHDLLDPAQQRAFRRMAVFAGGCDLEAAEAVLVDGEDPRDPLELVESLLDSSLVRTVDGPAGEPRIWMLQTIREFAGERLTAAGERDAICRRHSEHFAALAERAAPELRGPDQRRWRRRVEAEQANVAQALAWATGSDEDLPLAVRIAGALAWFWYGHGHATEGRQWLERIVAQSHGADDAELADVLHGLGVLLLQQDATEQAIPVLEQALAVWQRRGDRSKQARELNSLGVAHRTAGHTSRAQALLERSTALARTLGDRRRLATGLSNLALVHTDAAEPEVAVGMLEESLALDRVLDDGWGAAVDVGNLAIALVLAGSPDRALELLRSVSADVVELGDTELVADSLERFAAVWAALGLASRAARLVGAPEQIRDEAAMPLVAVDAGLLDRCTRAARAQLGEPGWAAANVAGRSLTSADAMAEAVSAAPSPQ